VILPAEYNIDPTGVGEKLGLTVLSEPVQNMDTEAMDTQATVIPNKSPEAHDFREDAVVVTVPANKGIEYKFHLKEFAKITYDWKTLDGSSIYFDFHGEPAGDTTGFFESYSIATTDKMNGTATVPFAGSHGWYWRNTSDQAVSIELKTSGNYVVTGLK
jgi:hypothetical protein